MMSIPTFDSILELIDTHGEPVECQLEECVDCETIQFARKFYSGGEGNKKKKKIDRRSFKYTAIDETGKEFIFYSQREISRFIKCGIEKLRDMVLMGISHKGFIVFKEDLRQ